MDKDFCKQQIINNLNSWMQYITKDQRNVYIFDFETKQKTEVMTF